MAQPAGRKYSPEDFQGMLKEVQGSLKTGDAKLTTQELQGISALFENKEMADELNAYMAGMADPKHKEETEEWIQQEERRGNVPQGKVTLHPQVSGLSLWAKYKPGSSRAGEPLIINVVRSKEVGRPQVEPAEDGSRGQKVALPAVAGPLRHETGADVGPLVGKGPTDLITTIDVVVHDEAIARTLGNTPYCVQWQRLVVEVCLEQADRRAHMDAGGAGIAVLQQVPLLAGDDHTLLALEKDVKRLKRPYTSGMSTPPTMLVPNTAVAGGAPPPLQASSSPSLPSSSGKAAAAALSQPEQTKPAMPRKAALPVPPVAPVHVKKGPDGVYLREPGLRLTERLPFSLTDHTQGRAHTVASTRPQGLAVDIAVPGVAKPAELSVHVEVQEVSVTSDTVFHDEPSVTLPPGEGMQAAGTRKLMEKVGKSGTPFRYHAVYKLPYPVSTAEGDFKATWNRESGVMSLTLSVLPPPKVMAPSFSPVVAVQGGSVAADEVSELDDAKKVKAGASTSSSKPVPLGQLPAAHSTWVKERVEATGIGHAAPPQTRAHPPAPAPPPSQPVEEEGARAGGEPPYRWRQTPTMVSVIFDVPRVDRASVQVEWGTCTEGHTEDVTLTFKSAASPVQVAAALGHASAAGLAAGAAPPDAAGTAYIYSIQLRLGGRVATTGGGDRRVDVTDTNVVLLLTKGSAGAWTALVRGPPDDVAAAAATSTTSVPASSSSSGKSAAVAAPAPTLPYPVPPDSGRCKRCRGWGKDLLGRDGRCGHCARAAGEEAEPRVAAGARAAPVAVEEEEEEEVFEVGANGTFDITGGKKKAAPAPVPAPVPAPLPSSTRSAAAAAVGGKPGGGASPAGKAGPKQVGLLDLD